MAAADVMDHRIHAGRRAFQFLQMGEEIRLFRIGIDAVAEGCCGRFRAQGGQLQAHPIAGGTGKALAGLCVIQGELTLCKDPFRAVMISLDPHHIIVPGGFFNLQFQAGKDPDQVVFLDRAHAEPHFLGIPGGDVLEIIKKDMTAQGSVRTARAHEDRHFQRVVCFGHFDLRRGCVLLK